VTTVQTAGIAFSHVCPTWWTCSTNEGEI